MHVQFLAAKESSVPRHIVILLLISFINCQAGHPLCRICLSGNDSGLEFVCDFWKQAAGEIPGIS